MHPGRISIKDFSYLLPEERIAKYPLPDRDESKLLVYRNGSIQSDIYLNLDTYLPYDAFLVFNNTRVVEARLLFQKLTGGSIELFCLEPGDRYADIATAMQQSGKVIWKCLVGGAKKWKEEFLLKTIEHSGNQITLRARKIEKSNDYYIIELSWNDPAVSFAELLHLAGSVPLPPYLNRDAEESDLERYQTIYARQDGSVAAPTAGLHFTQRLFDKLDRKNIRYDFVTLHVGAGTFKPVKSETIQEHEMHAEFIEAGADMIKNLLSHLEDTIIAVGTTSLRTIESLYWLGLKVYNDPRIKPEALQLQQWDAFGYTGEEITAEKALGALLQWMNSNKINKLIAKTRIIIAPGYTLKIAKALITNFHQPQSTLLLLIASITGDDWKKLYEYALENNFRFLSYGDGCLLYPVV